MTLQTILASKALKELANDFILSAGVALGGVVVGTWGEAQASAGVISFLLVRTLVLAVGKAVLRWANT